MMMMMRRVKKIPVMTTRKGVWRGDAVFGVRG
jgi:hypothetical protein